MLVVFRSNQLRRAYEVSAYGERLWGTLIGRRYILRIDSLYAAPDWEEVKKITAFHVHPLKADRSGDWAIALSGKWRLIVVPSDDDLNVTIREVTNHYGD